MLVTYTAVTEITANNHRHDIAEILLKVVQNVEFQSNIKRDYFLELLRNSLCPIG
jgi:hypothetical protein